MAEAFFNRSKSTLIKAVQPADARGRRRIRQKRDKQGRAYATGRRKESVARVWIKPGTGKIRSMAATRKSISRVRCCA